MVGSNRGWIDAGYVAAPATIDALAANVVRPIEGVAIVPGVSRSVDGRGDVMRGEEVQLLGAAAVGMVPPDSLLRSEEHTSELQSLMRISYAVFCLKKKKKHNEPKAAMTQQ